MSETLLEKIKKELEALQPARGLAPSDVVGFSEPLRGTLNHALRAGQITLSELADMLTLSRQEALEIARLLKAKGCFQQRINLDSEETIYDVHLSARTRKLDETLPKKLWDKLDDL